MQLQSQTHPQQLQQQFYAMQPQQDEAAQVAEAAVASVQMPHMHCQQADGVQAAQQQAEVAEAEVAEAVADVHMNWWTQENKQDLDPLELFDFLGA